jgi:hypothetical protein
VEAYFDDRTHGYNLAEPGAESGFLRICPTYAEIFRDGPTIFGNFLLPGGHWNEVKAAREDHEQARLADSLVSIVRRSQHRHIRVALRILAAVPPGTARTAATAGLGASQRIRTERRMVFATSVALEATFATITFEPIEGPTSRLLVPFRLHTDDGDLTGGLVLGEVDPLHIEIYEDNLHDDARAWSTALQGFADLTTYDLIAPARAKGGAQRVESRTRRPHAANQQSVPRRPPRRQHHP